MTHLSEEERQGLADGTLAAGTAAAAAAHVASCESCSADVERLAALVRRLQRPADAEQSDAAAALWPSLHTRIEGRKVISLRPPRAVAPRMARGPTARARAKWVGGLAALAAAAAVAFGVAVRTRAVTHLAPYAAVAPAPGAAAATPASNAPPISSADIQRLLDQVEMQKALLPTARAALADSDARVIDRAIRELRTALERDPANAQLRQLLAEAMAQQSDLLERMRNGS